MPRPDGGIITETNLQYYAGAQIIYTEVATQIYTFTFNTDLVMGSVDSWNPTDVDYALNNFNIYTSPTGIDQWTLYTTTFSLSNNIITLELVTESDGFTV